MGHFQRLTERASLNGIDISMYKGLPPEMTERVLSAIERACPKDQLDELAYNAEKLRKFVDSYVLFNDPTPFRKTFKKILSGHEHPPDLRPSIMSWDLILPEDGYLGWSSESISFGTDKLRDYVEKHDPEMGRNVIYFIMAEKLLQDPDADPALAVDNIYRKLFGTAAPPFSVGCGEMTACYLIFSGLPYEESFNIAADILMTLCETPNMAYKCLLEAAAFAVTVSDGIMAGMTCYEENRCRIRYITGEEGLFIKKPTAIPADDKRRLIADVSESLKRPGTSFTKLLESGAGHDSIVMWHVMRGLRRFNDFEQGIVPDREKLQYSMEVQKYLKEIFL